MRLPSVYNVPVSNLDHWFTKLDWGQIPSFRLSVSALCCLWWSNYSPHINAMEWDGMSTPRPLLFPSSPCPSHITELGTLLVHTYVCIFGSEKGYTETYTHHPSHLAWVHRNAMKAVDKARTLTPWEASCLIIASLQRLWSTYMCD